MASDCQYEGGISRGIHVRNPEWFWEFAKCTVAYAGILTHESMLAVARDALKDILQVLIEMYNEHDVMEVVMEVREILANVLFLQQDEEEIDILQQCLLERKKLGGFPLALAYARLALAQNRIGQYEQQLVNLESALSMIASLPTNEGNVLKKRILRILRKNKNQEKYNVNLYDKKNYAQPAKMGSFYLVATDKNRLQEHRHHINFQLCSFQNAETPCHDFIVMTLLELSEACAVEGMFIPARECLSHATTITKELGLNIQIPLQLYDILDQDQNHNYIRPTTMSQNRSKKATKHGKISLKKTNKS